jgi:CheY-like chemotaxis protein
MRGTGKTVLVVDDIAAHRYAVCRVLRSANYATIEAGWGVEAVEKAHQYHPDAVVLDMNLPDQSGLLTLKQLRSESDTAVIPVIFLSASAQSASDRDQAEAFGASAYLFSPVEPDTLLSVVMGVIQRRTDSKVAG